MIEVYYTNSSSFNSEQDDPTKSLGGFISCSRVANGSLDNVFGPLTSYSSSESQEEYRAIAVKNVSGFTLTSLKVWVSYANDGGSPVSENTNTSIIDIGFQEPVVDDCSNLKTELLPNRFSRPFLVQFEGAENEVNALSLPNLSNDSYIVIYLKRSALESSKTPTSTDECISILNGETEKIMSEDISLFLGWV